METQKKKATEFKFVDVCCGIGAFHVALKKLGGKCVLACDRNEKSKAVYLRNHGDTDWHDDIYKLDRLPVHDVFCAGFPCTTFSLAGLREGTKDKDAGQIIFKIMSLLSDAVADSRAPSIVLLENVVGLLSIHKGKTLKYIVDNLELLGYSVDVRVHDARDFGAPMHRQRVIIAATRGFAMDPDAKVPGKKSACIRTFLDSPTLPRDEDLSLADNSYVILPKNDWYDTNGKIFVGFRTAVNYEHADLSKISAHKQALKIYHEDGLAENFTGTHRYAFLVDGKARFLSTTEMYACMGFPKSFKLYVDAKKKEPKRSVRIRQLSNSINLHMLSPVCRWVVTAWRSSQVS